MRVVRHCGGHMNTKQLGFLFVFAGILIAFALFATCNWIDNIEGNELSFWFSFRYSPVFLYSCDQAGECVIRLELAESLIFPMFIIGLGFIIQKDIISINILKKIFPFIKS
jgi:hypothetical protein